MAKVTVTVTTKIPFNLDRIWIGPGGGKFQNDMEKTITEEITDAMSRGQSPVRGYGRFKAYKKPDKYPTRKGEIRGFKKRVRPVNLFLSGALYKSFSSELSDSGNALTYGTLKAKDPVDIYAAVHNNGERHDIAQRKFIPNELGEKFTPGIMDRIKEVIAKRVREILNL